MPRLKNPPKPRERLEPLWYPPRQASELLNLSQAQLYAEMKEGRLPYIQDPTGRKILAETIRQRTTPAE